MQIIRPTKNGRFKSLKSGDVFSWLNCMDESPNVYRLIEGRTIYCFNKNKIETLNDDDFDCLVHVYDNPILNLSNS